MTAQLITDLDGWQFVGCSCLAAWWPAVQRAAVARGLVHRKLDVTQGCYSDSGVAASAATHDGGGVLDIAQRGGAIDDLLEEAGAAAFERDARDGMPPHTHLVLIGCPHLDPSAAAQVAAWKAGRNGLANNALDRDRTRPATIRTWRAGLAWLNAQLATLEVAADPDTIHIKELDTMTPTQLKALITEAVDAYVNSPKGKAAIARAAWQGGTFGDVVGDGRGDDPITILKGTLEAAKQTRSNA
ncbi:hypothetical protein ACQCX5_14365 [Propionibacteriaceae bacterium G57]|uniref:hypothetical protein n=1 Tax=Aestuariimicrobium sp. G57 TaxID=3418485 RepID=UPI003DA7845D